MPSAKKIAVAGATGRVGHHVTDVLTECGHDVVPMSRSQGVDVITGSGLAAALTGVECVIDAAAGHSPEQQAATAFFTTAARNLHQAGQRAGVRQSPGAILTGPTFEEWLHSAACRSKAKARRPSSPACSLISPRYRRCWPRSATSGCA